MKDVFGPGYLSDEMELGLDFSKVVILKSENHASGVKHEKPLRFKRPSEVNPACQDWFMKCLKSTPQPDKYAVKALTGFQIEMSSLVPIGGFCRINGYDIANDTNSAVTSAAHFTTLLVRSIKPETLDIWIERGKFRREMMGDGSVWRTYLGSLQHRIHDCVPAELFNWTREPAERLCASGLSYYLCNFVFRCQLMYCL